MAAYQAVLETPIGAVALRASDTHLTAIHFLGDAEPHTNSADRPPVLEQAIGQLAAYFAGERQAFDLPLAPAGTDFEHRVWDYLQSIPFGETRSYGAVAEALGDANLVRAVGRANARNPIAIVIPCHRVIGHDGALTGYAGGLWRKEWLLGHEGRPQQPRLF